MRITPLDVRKQEFRKVMRGLDADEVFAFLATVADEYEAVLNDNKALRERLLELDDKVQEYRGIERTLRDTLLTAERVTVEARDNARREATLIIKEAQLNVEKSLRDISSEAVRLRQEVQRLRSQRDAYLSRMKVVVESHAKFIDSAERDFRADDDAVPEPAPSRASKPLEPEVIAPPVKLFDTPLAAPSTSMTDEIPGLTDIIDRLSQGQRDMMESAKPAPAPPAPAAASPPAPASTEDSEWNMDQIRHDLQKLASSSRIPEGPNL